MSTIPAGSIVENSSLLPATGRSKRRDLIEIAIGYILILIVIWTPRPWQRLFWAIAVAGIVYIMARSFDGWRALGFRTRNFFRSFWVVGLALIFCACTVLISMRLHTYRQPENTRLLFGAYWSYALFSAVQQFLLQGFFLLRMVRLFPRARQAAFAAAGLFALAHLPNPILAALTLVWGTLACMIFLRYRNLYPLAIAHAILGITIGVAVPGPMIHNMRVGLGYLRYRGEPRRLPTQRSHRDQIASTDAWVTADEATRRELRQARP